MPVKAIESVLGAKEYKLQDNQWISDYAKQTEEYTLELIETLQDNEHEMYNLNLGIEGKELKTGLYVSEPNWFDYNSQWTLKEENVLMDERQAKEVTEKTISLQTDKTEKTGKKGKKEIYCDGPNTQNAIKFRDKVLADMTAENEESTKNKN